MAGHEEERGPAPMMWYLKIKKYLQVIVALVVITIAEVAVPYLPFIHVHPNETNQFIGIFALGVLAVVKYALVVMFFMHLYHDHKLCTFLFGAGMFLGGSTVIALLLMVPPPIAKQGKPIVGETAGVPETKAWTGPKLSPEAEKGMALFEQHCVTCHTVKQLATAQGVIGPPLDGIAVNAGKREPGKSAEQYMFESIKSPNQFVVEGYPPAMTDFQLPDDQIKQLVAFLSVLKDEGGNNK